MSTEEAMQRLQRQADDLRADWYAAGRGDEFEDMVSRMQSHGTWPFFTG